MKESRDRILLVDDHPVNLTILEIALGDHYELATAASGHEALKIAPTFRPALILLDIMMPGIDGYETCRRLRDLPETKSAKIVMVSAKAMAAERVAGYAAGADDYITKPFDEDELVAKVKVYLQLSRAEEIATMKSDVIALLSHELNTPMTTIRVPLELMQQKRMDDSERDMLVEMALASVDRLDRFVQKVTMLCAFQAGVSGVKREREDMAALVTEAVDKCKSKSAKVNFTTELQPVTAMVDGRHLRFVVAALLDNASRAGQDVRVELSGDDNTLRLTVHDNGDGIPAEFQPRVFDPFACREVNLHGGGHGLSLAISRYIVAAHGGAIAVTSETGTGTTFSVEVPIGVIEEVESEKRGVPA